MKSQKMKSNAIESVKAFCGSNMVQTLKQLFFLCRPIPGFQIPTSPYGMQFKLLYGSACTGQRFPLCGDLFVT